MFWDGAERRTFAGDLNTDVHQIYVNDDDAPPSGCEYSVIRVLLRLP